MKFCKHVLGVKISTQNDFIYGELGRKSIQTQRFYNIIKYWFKVIGTPDRKYVNCLYNMMLNDMRERPNKQNWASLVKNLLSDLGFYYVRIAQGVGNINKFLSILKQRLTDNFIQNWNSRLLESSRSIFYRHFANFAYQPYLDIISIRKFRVSFTKLRVCSHRLAVETGRWHKPHKIPYQNRKCQFCNTLEDEYHFLFECAAYNDLRLSYMPKFYRQRPSMYKTIELLNSNNKKNIRNVGVFISKSFETRNDILSYL